jgi:fused signal recognition particle receptor
MIFKRKITSASAKTEATPATPTLGLFARLKQSLTRTSHNLTTLFHGRKTIDATLLSDLEDNLLLADVGVPTTKKIMAHLTQSVSRHEIDDAPALVAALKTEMTTLLEPYARPLNIDPTQKPFVILVVGVNGVGKTTTIGKLAQQFKKQGLSVLLAAGDTFRAAAIEQLQTWGERNDVPVITQQSGSDSAAVIYDAILAAKARGIDVVLADTAGRLHTQHNLMEELKKVVRVINKAIPTAPHETLLVLDATTGQNALQQAKLFHEAAKVSGVILTKLDGSAKGGIVFALTEHLQLPIRFIGVGEQAEDLQIFNAEQFVEALLTE